MLGEGGKKKNRMRTTSNKVLLTILVASIVGVNVFTIGSIIVKKAFAHQEQQQIVNQEQQIVNQEQQQATPGQSRLPLQEQQSQLNQEHQYLPLGQ